MTNLLYKIGGYDPNIIKVGRLGGVRFLSPGLSLLIICCTSLWGGMHLADKIIDNPIGQVVFTAVFILIIFSIDLMLIHSGNNLWARLLRVFLAFTLGIAVAILTSLALFSSEIRGKKEKDIYTSVESNDEIKNLKTQKEGITMMRLELEKSMFEKRDKLDREGLTGVDGSKQGFGEKFDYRNKAIQRDVRK